MTALSEKEIDTQIKEEDDRQVACGARASGHTWVNVYSETPGYLCVYRSTVYKRCDDCCMTEGEPPFLEWIKIDKIV
jgi:hypothetical protein